MPKAAKRKTHRWMPCSGLFIRPFTPLASIWLDNSQMLAQKCRATMTKTKKDAQPNRKCFVISPIGDEGSDIRRRADQILKHIIEPAAAACNYETIRADKISEPGIITSQVIQHIVEDTMVVADLTGRNPNVFYELAIRHAIRKPFVQMIKHDEPIPFDVAANRTIKVDHRDLDSVALCRDELIRQMQSTESDEVMVDNPITVALNVQNLLRQSDDPIAKSAAELIGGLNEIKSMVSQSLVLSRNMEGRSRELESMLASARLPDMMLAEEMYHLARRVRSLATEKNSTESLKHELQVISDRAERLSLRMVEPRLVVRDDEIREYEQFARRRRSGQDVKKE